MPRLAVDAYCLRHRAPTCRSAGRAWAASRRRDLGDDLGDDLGFE